MEFGPAAVPPDVHVVGVEEPGRGRGFEPYALNSWTTDQRGTTTAAQVSR
jgi:hypothetical protein